MLSYVTVGGDTPKDKVNILILPHPAERMLVGDIADDILAALDCAVWYNDGDDCDYGLDDMNLVVIPVTGRLLADFDAVRDVVFAARGRGIPILPILIEKVSMDEYQTVFASTQFIDKHLGINPIGYSTSLETYLASYKSNASFNESIHASFDVKAFVSYRHKDRPLMQELIRNIHDNPGLVDVAVWYDDKLTAGRDFNDEILTSVRAADVFILAVTPSLLEAGNYVERKEYPTAVEAGIPILPVMVADTPLSTLYEMYPGLPEPCSFDMIESRLRDLLGDRLDRANDNDGEHLFYMGLAYLFGTGVEIDRARARDLFIRADELGFYEALRWLAIMCFDTSIDSMPAESETEYCRRYCIACYKEYRNNTEDAEAWLSFCSAAQLYLSNITRNNIVDDLNIWAPYVDSCAIMLEKRQNSVTAEKIIEAAGVSYRYMIANGMQDHAAKMLESALSIARIMWENGEDGFTQMYVSTLIDASKFELQRGNKEAAEEYIFTALTVLEAASEYIPDTDRKFRELAVNTYHEVSSLCLRLEDYLYAARACIKLAELYEGLSEHNSLINYKDIIYSCRQLSFECYCLSEQPDDARIQLACIRSFLDENKSTDRAVWLQRELSYLTSSAELECMAKRYKAAEQMLKNAEALAKENEPLVAEDMFFEIHEMYTYVYFAWGKQYLAEYHQAIILQNYRNTVIERGSEEDYRNFADALPTPSNAFGVREEKKEWHRYKELANKGTLNFYPDDSHLERERDTHLASLLRDGIAGTVCTVLLALYIILDYHFAFLFKDRMLLWFVTFFAWLFAGPTPIKLVLYGYYRAQRGREYSALWAFRFSGLVKTASTTARIVLTVLSIGFMIVYYASPGAAILTDGLGAIYIIGLLLAFVQCTINLLDRAMEQERLRAFWRISRLKPLEEQPK